MVVTNNLVNNYRYRYVLFVVIV